MFCFSLKLQKKIGLEKFSRAKGSKSCQVHRWIGGDLESLCSQAKHKKSRSAPTLDAYVTPGVDAFFEAAIGSALRLNGGATRVLWCAVIGTWSWDSLIFTFSSYSKNRPCELHHRSLLSVQSFYIVASNEHDILSKINKYYQKRKKSVHFFCTRIYSNKRSNITSFISGPDKVLLTRCVSSVQDRTKRWK